MIYRLCDFMEVLSLDNIQPTDNQIAEILNAFTNDDLNELCLHFLRGISNKHNVPGKIVQKISHISYLYPSEGFSNKQRYYLFHNILFHWSEINIAYKNILRL
jgi:hypothetical protein